jgi:hypothetical protein
VHSKVLVSGILVSYNDSTVLTLDISLNKFFADKAKNAVVLRCLVFMKEIENWEELIKKIIRHF